MKIELKAKRRSTMLNNIRDIIRNGAAEYETDPLFITDAIKKNAVLHLTIIIII
jgi:hypothetical protein